MNLKKSLVLLFLLLSCSVPFFDRSNPALTSHELVMLALANTSSAPSYLLVKVAGPSDSQFTPVCMVSIEFQHLIADELGIDRELHESQQKIFNYVFENPELKFRFSRKVRPDYSDTLLQIAASELDGLSREKLIELVCSSEIYNVFENNERLAPILQYNSWLRIETAIAHVYFEKGIMLDRSCVDGGVYLGGGVSHTEIKKCEGIMAESGEGGGK